MKNEKREDTAPYTGKAYAYVAIGLTCAGAVAYGLSFTVLGIYALIASVLCALGALSFANVQKKKNNFGALVYITVCAYVVLIVSVATFIGGIIYAAAAG